jgi:hypothetical protein
MTNISPLHSIEQLFLGSYQSSSSSSSIAMANFMVTKFLSSIHFAFLASAVVMFISIIPSLAIKWKADM